METPSSTRRVTRSQTLSAMNSCGGKIHSSSKKEDDTGNSQMKSRQRGNKDRSALIDITNDSPIVGVAMQTPSSDMATKKKSRRIKRTPGSGEALLRGQVKTLLQKVEEEAVLTKISTVPFHHLVSSPMGLVAPTPANTPQLPNSDIVIAPSPALEEDQFISTLPKLESCLMNGDHQEDEVGGICEGLKSLNITRSLLLDFSDKSESSLDSSRCSSAVTHTGEDDSSVWSMLVNAGTTDGDDDGDEQVSSFKGEEEEEEEENKRAVVEFEGKHTRFVYDSDGEEMVEEQSVDVLRLKGLPTPQGKHFRFAEEEEDS
ncbi:PREDICTED: uncharacterized protein LOC104819178 [Tarenaya hassleriana]|uniref:uncharacterized protein LOC104819178 n=1 Tax=Tarenaya hassleriana TaxID=28532 RepID=UPI00053C1E8B|nr:PREDICTED: uncharacterized protein LOC104819178 [Tarenaya hassleriana]